jgi:ATP-binding cassette, subfamily F, member 3
MIQVTNLTKSFGTQVLFSDISFTVGKGERVGLVGRNGSGKSTLLKILLGEELFDGGKIQFPTRYKIASLKQHLEFTESTILQEVCLALPEEQAFDRFRAEKILMGLGFEESDFSRGPNEFSGGMQIRLNLAKVLLEDPDCLFLDEPTNYLDIVGMRWLSRFLRSFQGSVILITHDSGFMDEVCTHTMGIWRERLVKIEGSTQKFYEKIVLDEEIYMKTRENLDKKRKEMEQFVERFKAKASKAAQAQSRVKMLDKLQTMDELKAVGELDFRFNLSACPGKNLLEVRDISFGWSEEQILFKSLSFFVERNDKICVIGKNGKGKSTLLSVLSGERAPLTGYIKSHPSMKLGYFGQTNITRLHMNHSIEQEILAANPEIGLQKVRSICGTMMFPKELAEKKISVLSGGERARVLLGKILAIPTNLLLLDEPSNHLDQQSIESLLEELIDYEGAAIIVTHSESFVRQLATKLIVFHEDRVEFFLGSYDDFLRRGGWGDEIGEKAPSEVVTVKKDRNAQKKMRAEIIQERSRTLSPMKKKMSELETKIERDESKASKVEEDLIQNKGDMAQLSRELGVLRKAIDQNFEELTEITLKHDDIFNDFEKKLTEIND